MENKQYNSFKTSDICNGYGAGLSCVACCCDVGAPCWSYPEVKDLFSVELNVRAKGSVDTCRISECPPEAVLESINPTFEEFSKLFDNLVEENTRSFEEKIRKGICLEEISRMPSDFVGKINGRIGCLIYPNDSPKNDPRLSMCGSFLCPLAKFYEGNEIADFVNENISKLSVLSYSRMIYAINYHSAWLSQFFGINLQKDKRMSDLSRLLEIVKV